MNSLLSRFRKRLRRWKFDRSIRLLKGPASVDSGSESVVVVCLVRDGLRYIPEFLRHYRDLGVERFAFIDNGSKDGTIELLAEQADVSLLKTDVPYRVCKVIAKQYLADQFGRRNWVLLVDVDELFQFPRCEDLTLKGLIRYLNHNDYSAVACQMLDMFPDRPLLATDGLVVAGRPQRSWREDHRFYSIAGLRALPYAAGPDSRCCNLLDLDSHRFFYGGIRHRKFDSDVLLTKHPLFFPARGAKLVDCHLVGSARIADLSGVLLHYKYVSGFFEYVKQIASEGAFYNRSAEYKKFEKVLSFNHECSLYDETSIPYQSTSQLIDHGFIVASPRYLDYVDRCADARQVAFSSGSPRSLSQAA
jgi:hypothetical protein